MPLKRGRLGRNHRRDLHQILKLFGTLFPHCNIKYISGWTQDRFFAH
jgi:hypothetical protein